MSTKPDPQVEKQVDKIIPDLTDTQWIRLRDLIHQLTQEARIDELKKIYDLSEGLSGNIAGDIWEYTDSRLDQLKNTINKPQRKSNVQP